MISILRIGPIMVFDTYHRMISKGTYWAGPCLIVLKPALVGISDLVLHGISYKCSKRQWVSYWLSFS